MIENLRIVLEAGVFAVWQVAQLAALPLGAAVVTVVVARIVNRNSQV